MHIQTQLCSLAIMLLLVFFFRRHRRVGLFSEKIFWLTLCVTIFSVCCDAVSLLAIYLMNSLPQLLVDAVCKLYLCSLIWVGCAALSYTCTDFVPPRKYMFYWRKLLILAGVESIVVFCLPIYYHVKHSEVYTYGPSVMATYVFALLFVAATVCCALIFRKRMNPRRQKAVLMWMGMWIVCALIQFLNNHLLLVGFGCGLGMLVLFCTLENPENSMDREYNCYHMSAMLQYLREAFERQQPLSVLYISMVVRQNEANMEQVHKGIEDIIAFAQKKKHVKIFKNIGAELVLVCEDMNSMNAVFRAIQDTFYADYFYNPASVHEHLMPNSLFALLPDTTALNSADEVLRVFNYLKSDNHNMNITQVSYVNQMILDELREREACRQMLVDALEADRVEVFYQPIYSNAQERFVSAEALARIRTADGELISPGKFIPVAEETGLILQLGERVFEKVCAFLRDGKAFSLGLDYVEINLSVVQCRQWNLASRYLSILDKYEVEPWRINLEITETGSVESKKTLLDNMQQLIDKGVSFSLDDFGNGQSNLDYMIDMPVSVMKLDMNMTKAYFQDLKARYVVNATMQLAHELDLLIVAEGVETKEEYEEMKRLGVDDIQGYYFSKPLPPADFLGFLRERQGCELTNK